MKLSKVQDITPNTIPTYTVLRKYADHSGFDPSTFIKAQGVTEYGSKLGALKYMNLVFEKVL